MFTVSENVIAAYTGDVLVILDSTFPVCPGCNCSHALFLMREGHALCVDCDHSRREQTC